MFHGSIVAWIAGVCSVLRHSQAEALGEITWGAMRWRRACRAYIHARRLLLLSIGPVRQEAMPEVHWTPATSRSQKQASAFFVGRHVQPRVKLRLRTLLKALSETLAEISEGTGDDSRD